MNVLCASMRFHTHHGSNIELDAERLHASRKTSFANALTFSERPLAPGEIFLIEIEENESGWSGHLRLGLTQKSPDTQFDLPLYALPDLLSIGPSWAYAITKTSPRELSIEDGVTAADIEHDQVAAEAVGAIEENLSNYQRYPRVIHREGCRGMLRTPRGLIHENTLMPFGGKLSCGTYNNQLLPTDVGSRIGVMFVPRSGLKANMHFVINGEDQGPYSREIPYTDGPLYALVDVYGSTKGIRIVQGGVESLQSLCRNVILSSIKMSGVSNLPLPASLKKYLLFTA